MILNLSCLISEISLGEKAKMTYVIVIHHRPFYRNIALNFLKEYCVDEVMVWCFLLYLLAL